MKLLLFVFVCFSIVGIYFAIQVDILREQRRQEIDRRISLLERKLKDIA